MPNKTDQDMACMAQAAQSLGFNTILALPPRDRIPALIEECHQRGISLYLSTVFSGGDASWRQVMTPEEEARAKLPFGIDYQIGGQPVSADELLQSPLPCWNRPEVREMGARKVLDLASLGADGLAFDCIGYRNYTRCHCPVCEEKLAEYRAEHPEMDAKTAEARWAEEVLVHFNNEMAAVAREAKPGIKLTTHVYPVFLPNPYYGYRLNLDYTGETVSWFFRPHWSLDTVRERAQGIVSRQGTVWPRQTAAPFVAFDARKHRDYRSARRIRQELRLVKDSGAKALQMAELGYILQYPGVARAVARELSGDFQAQGDSN
ncbi:MAG: hypothetical protein HPY44_14015 [Armatimonadetes bacterium]|nr:hypothetical protein [Armatimonadota bacterium]